jgi:hypothetical protein
MIFGTGTTVFDNIFGTNNVQVGYGYVHLSSRIRVHNSRLQIHGSGSVRTGRNIYGSPDTIIINRGIVGRAISKDAKEGSPKASYKIHDQMDIEKRKTLKVRNLVILTLS